MLITRVLCFALAAQMLHAGSGSLTYSTYLGGNGSDYIHAIAIDSSNNIYVTGETYSSNFPVTPGAFQKTHGGTPGAIGSILGPGIAQDAFVVKLNPAGRIVYATYLGGTGHDVGFAIAVDSTGSAYVTGTTTSNNFPVTAGAYQTKIAGNTDIFVAKLSPDGSALTYSTLLGGSGYDSVASLALDSLNNACIAGYSESADFPTTAGAYRKTGTASFVAKLNATGTAIVWATFLGDSTGGAATSVAVDTTGNVYTAGTTYSSAFPVTAGTIQNTIGVNNSNAFVVKLNPTATTAFYSATIGGHGYTTASAIALDAQGNAFIAGGTNATDFPVTPGALQSSISGGTDGFVLKLNRTATSLSYSTYLGGTGGDNVTSIAVDSTGSAYVSGSTSSTNFPVTIDALPKRFAGSPCLITGATPFANPPLVGLCGDAFAAKLNPAGAALTYSTYLSGSNADSASAVALTSSGALYVAGSTESDNFPTAGTPATDTRYPTTCEEIASPSSSQSFPCDDGFLARIDFNGSTTPPLRLVNFGDLIDAPVAPAGIVTLFGAGIGPSAVAILQLDSSSRIATTLNATQVLFDGVPAPLIRVDANQITAIVPHSVAGKAHSVVTVQLNGKTTATASVAILEAAPAFLTLDPAGIGQVAAINLDGTLNTPSTPAPKGGIVSLYLEGFAPSGTLDGALATAAANMTNAPQVIVGGQLAQVLYAGPSPGSTEALTQINIQLPSQATGQMPVYVLFSGSSTQYGAALSVQ
jgi:uncharacterized protein (TIGR03437 family)